MGGGTPFCSVVDKQWTGNGREGSSQQDAVTSHFIYGLAAGKVTAISNNNTSICKYEQRYRDTMS